ncbi:MAG: sugar phosphate isomerase/epimerase family protein [bacterium]
MKLGCCSWSYHREFEAKRMNIFDFMGVCAAELKVDGVEITGDHLDSLGEDYLRAVTRTAVDLHLTISAITMSNDFGLPTETERDRELEKVERAVAAAKEIGAPILRIFAGWPTENKNKEWDEMVRCMKIACLLAEREGVVLAVENHNSGGFIQTAADVHRLIKDVDSEWLRLNLDTGNYLDGFESIEKTLIYAVHIHAKMLDIAADGTDTTTDYADFFSLLSSINYRSFISLEYEGEEDETTAVPRGIGYLKNLIKEYKYRQGKY